MHPFKNRDRDPYSFANINLLGRCNLDCFFCLGKDLKKEFSQYDHRDTPARELPRLGEFLWLCRENGIKKVYITGQNVDPLQYRDLQTLIDIIQAGHGLQAGIRTNGLLADRMVDVINTCRGTISYTVLTLKPDVMWVMTKSNVLPWFDEFIPLVTIPQRMATVVTGDNAGEILELIGYAARFRQIRYFQVRRISTDTRQAKLQKDMYAFDELLERFRRSYKQIGEFATAPVFQVGNINLPVVFWSTVGTTANSINYFSNGVISDEYFIIEGYEKNKGRYLL